MDPKRSGPVIERPLASQSFSLDVKDTTKPFFSFGQLNVTELLVLLLGSVLNVPLDYRANRRDAEGTLAKDTR